MKAAIGMIIPATMPKTGINILSICNSYINLLNNVKYTLHINNVKYTLQHF